MDLLAVGRVARAHGVRGRVLIAPYNAESQGLERVRRLWLGEREYEVDRAERVHLGYLVALRGVGSRDEADALRGQEVRADRGELPPLEPGELYAIDLIGFTVVDAQGATRHRDDDGKVRRGRARQHPGLLGPEGGLAAHLEDVGHGHPGGPDDLRVGVEVAPAQPLGDEHAGRGLAHPHHPHQEEP